MGKSDSVIVNFELVNTVHIRYLEPYLKKLCLKLKSMTNSGNLKQFISGFIIVLPTVEVT